VVEGVDGKVENEKDDTADPPEDEAGVDDVSLDGGGEGDVEVEVAAEDEAGVTEGNENPEEKDDGGDCMAANWDTPPPKVGEELVVLPNEGEGVVAEDSEDVDGEGIVGDKLKPPTDGELEGDNDGTTMTLMKKRTPAALWRRMVQIGIKGMEKKETGWANVTFPCHRGVVEENCLLLKPRELL